MGANILNILLGVGQIVAGIFLMGTGAGALAGARLLLSGGLTLMSAFMPRKSGGDGWKSSPRYGFDNAVNVTNEGSVKLVVFGRERIAPPIISANLVQEGDKQALWLLCYISEGEIDSVHDIEVNDTPLTEGAFPGSWRIVKRGTASQSADWAVGGGADGVGGDVIVRGFNQVARPYDVGATLNKDATAPFTYQMKDSATSLTLNFVWPSGLFAVDNGKTKSVASKLRIRYKANGAADTAYRSFAVPQVGTKREQGSWSGTSIEGEWKTEAAIQNAAVRRSIRLDFPTAGAYTVEVRGEEEEDTTGTYQARRVPNVEGVVELVNDQRAYANSALLAIKVYASESLSGSLPHVTCTVKGVKCYDPRDGTTAWTRNPVLIAREILTNSRWGMGHRFASADLDEGVGGSWRTMADLCDATVTPRGQPAEPRFMCDLVMDQRADAMDWVTQVLGSCRMALVDADGLFKVVVDDAETGAADLTFEARSSNTSTRHNVARAGDDTSSLEVRHMPESERFNVIRARFTDETDRFRTAVFSMWNITAAIGSFTGTPTAGEEFTGGTSGATGRYVWHRGGVLYYVQDYGATALTSGETLTFKTSGATVALTAAPVASPATERVEEVQLWGVVRPTQILREMRYRLNLSLMAPYFAMLASGVGDVQAEAGDCADVSDDVHGYSAKRFRVLDLARDDTGTMQLSMREHVTAVYADRVDSIPAPGRFVDPVGAVPTDLRPPSTAGDSTPVNTPAAPSTPAGSSAGAPAPSSGGTVAATPSFGTPTTTGTYFGWKKH